MAGEQVTDMCERNDEKQAEYLEVQAEVRYWEDASVNGTEDTDGKLIPLRDDKQVNAPWHPVIRLSDGQIMDWPEGTIADIHYKVCDQGEYWLLDAKRDRIAKWNDYYVPGDALCIGGKGFGDYIVMKIKADGKIQDWNRPDLPVEKWEEIKCKNPRVRW